MQGTDSLDLNLAWIRVKNDIKDQIFINHPYLVDIIDYKMEEWLRGLNALITAGKYSPSKCQIVDVPKPGWHIRPGGVLTMEDMTVYSALVLKILPNISDNISWSERKYRFSNILNRSVYGRKWTEFPVESWKAFKNVALNKARKYQYGVKFDLASFFENIEIKRLMEDLEEMSCDKEYIETLSTCLNRWAGSRRRGIPQGFLPSNILSEVYLNSIDQAVVNLTIDFVRYVDDGYLFAKSHEEAVKALRLFTRILRGKGLYLQSAKTRILPKKKIIEEIEEVNKEIQKADKVVRKDMFRTAGIVWGYLNPAQIAEIYKDKVDPIPIKSLRKVFDKSIKPIPDTFNKTLFHYILSRFGASNDDYAVNFCLETLGTRPEEASAILRYLKIFKQSHMELISGQIVRQLTINDSKMLDYSRFKLIEWLFDEGIANESLVSIVRENLKVRDLTDWTRNYIYAYLGKYGNSADLDMLEDQYTKESDLYSKAVIVCSLRKLPISRRNEIYSRVKTDHDFVNLAVEWSKAQSL